MAYYNLRSPNFNKVLHQYEGTSIMTSKEVSNVKENKSPTLEV